MAHVRTPKQHLTPSRPVLRGAAVLADLSRFGGDSDSEGEFFVDVSSEEAPPTWPAASSDAAQAPVLPVSRLLVQPRKQQDHIKQLRTGAAKKDPATAASHPPHAQPASQPAAARKALVQGPSHPPSRAKQNKRLRLSLAATPGGTQQPAGAPGQRSALQQAVEEKPAFTFGFAL